MRVGADKTIFQLHDSENLVLSGEPDTGLQITACLMGSSSGANCTLLSGYRARTIAKSKREARQLVDGSARDCPTFDLGGAPDRIRSQLQSETGNAVPPLRVLGNRRLRPVGG